MPDSANAGLFDCLRLLLKPALRFALRYSLYLQDIVEALKIMLVEVAKEELERDGGDANVARLSAMTGLHRREVRRIFQQNEFAEEPLGLIPKILGQWQQDRRFRLKSGKPRILSVEGEGSDFKKLVQSISNDLKPGTVLMELERIGAIERTADGIKLIWEEYMPVGNAKQGLSFLASDTIDLMECVEENVFGNPEIVNLHGKTEYNNIREEAIPEIKDWFLEEGTAFHKKARAFLSQYDQDIDLKRPYHGQRFRAVLGTFSLVKKYRQG